MGDFFFSFFSVLFLVCRPEDKVMAQLFSLSANSSSRAEKTKFFDTLIIHLYRYWQVLLTTACINIELMDIFTNPSARVGCDTRSILKLGLTGLNLKLSFS